MKFQTMFFSINYAQNYQMWPFLTVVTSMQQELLPGILAMNELMDGNALYHSVMFG